MLGALGRLIHFPTICIVLSKQLNDNDNENVYDNVNLSS